MRSTSFSVKKYFILKKWANNEMPMDIFYAEVLNITNAAVSRELSINNNSGSHVFHFGLVDTPLLKIIKI